MRLRAAEGGVQAEVEREVEGGVLERRLEVGAAAPLGVAPGLRRQAEVRGA